MANNQLSSSKKYSKFILSSIVAISLIACSTDDSEATPEEDINTENGIDETTDNENSVEETNGSETISNEGINATDEEIIENNVDAVALLDLVNEFRVENGQSRLVLNSELNKAALNHSVDMNVNDYFSHTGLNGSNFGERIRETDYPGSPAAENIAVGQRTVEIVHNTWINSEGHRNNILNSRITDIGIGHNGRYWTQVFGITR